MERLVLLSIRAYIGEIESGEKMLRIFHIYILDMQCCVRVSDSNFQVLTRQSAGARFFGILIRFMAGPARTTDRQLRREL